MDKEIVEEKVQDIVEAMWNECALYWSKGGCSASRADIINNTVSNILKEILKDKE
jgi:hypothetical protein